MPPHQRRLRLSASIPDAQHRPLSGADGGPAPTQYRDREILQLYRDQVTDREERRAAAGAAGGATRNIACFLAPLKSRPTVGDDRALTARSSCSSGCSTPAAWR